MLVFSFSNRFSLRSHSHSLSLFLSFDREYISVHFNLSSFYLFRFRLLARATRIRNNDTAIARIRRLLVETLSLFSLFSSSSREQNFAECRCKTCVLSVIFQAFLQTEGSMDRDEAASVESRKYFFYSSSRRESK